MPINLFVTEAEPQSTEGVLLFVGQSSPVAVYSSCLAPVMVYKLIVRLGCGDGGAHVMERSGQRVRIHLASSQAA